MFFGVSLSLSSLLFYELFTRNVDWILLTSFSNGELMHQSNLSSPHDIHAAQCNPNDRFAILLHGWRESCNTSWMKQLIKSNFKKKKKKPETKSETILFLKSTAILLVALLFVYTHDPVQSSRLNAKQKPLKLMPYYIIISFHCVIFVYDLRYVCMPFGQRP